MEQVYFFLVCVAGGAMSGIVYDAFYLVKQFIAGRRVEISLDILYFLCLSVLYVFLSVVFGLPDFRLYFFCGLLLGAALYLKSIHIILAFFVKKMYTVIRKSMGSGKTGRISRGRSEKSKSERPNKSERPSKPERPR